MLEIQTGTFIHITKTYLNYNNFQCSTTIYCMLGSLLMFPQNVAEFSQLNLNFLQVLHVLWSSIVLPFSSTSQLHCISFNTFQPLICPSYFQIASCTFISVKKKLPSYERSNTWSCACQHQHPESCQDHYLWEMFQLTHPTCK